MAQRKEPNRFCGRFLLGGFILLAALGLFPGMGPAETDRNTNGIPDTWEQQYTGSITGMSATADSDTDTVNNLNEFLGGTDPNNPQSIFTIKSSTFNKTNGTILTWSNAPDRAYTITWSTNIMIQPFTNLSLATNLIFNPAQTWNVYTDATHMADMGVCYRLKASWTGALDVMTCLNCHNVSLGGHTNVVLDFTNLSHHVLYGSVTTNDCLACHNHDTHHSGLVVLHNADTNTILYTLTNSPLTSAVEAAKLTPFCLSCHDANGANGSAPFSDGHMPMDRNYTLWSASAHATTNGGATVNLSCYGDGKTFGCHASTHGSTKTNMLAPYNVAMTNVAQQEEGFCYTCHDGSKARKSVTAEFTKTYHHPVVNTDPIRTNQPTRTVECFDCHNQHATRMNTTSYTNKADASRNQVNGPSIGASGWNVTYSGAGLTNFVAPSITDYSWVSNSVFMYQICFKCHAGVAWKFDTNAAPKGLSSNGIIAVPVETDLAQTFSPLNYSGHPVVTGLNYYVNSATPRSLLAVDMKAPWTNNIGVQTMDCGDCHNTDSTNLLTEAQGPHGSAIPFMLRMVFSNAVTTAKGWPTNTLAAFNSSWCANCHNNTHSASGIDNNHNGFACYQCHIVIPHGGKMSRLIGDRDGAMPARYAFNNALTNMYINSFSKTNGTYQKSSCQATSSSCTPAPHNTAAKENW